MEKEKSGKTLGVGSMHKRQVVMADGQRYLIYYTFSGENAVGNSGKDDSKVALPESMAENSTVEEGKANV